MALNIKDPEAVRLAAEVAALTGESKTRAVRVALEERHKTLRGLVNPPDRAERLRRFLEREAWPQLVGEGGSEPLSKPERERILGIGEGGY